MAVSLIHNTSTAILSCCHGRPCFEIQFGSSDKGSSQSNIMESPVGRKSPQVLWNNTPKALKFFKILDRHPNYTHSSSSFDHIIDIAGRMRDYKTLWSLVAQLCSRRLSLGLKAFHGCPQDSNSFNTILDVLCTSNLVEKAYNLFKALRARFKVDIRTPKALEVLEEMVKKGLKPNLSSYNIMLKGYLRDGQIKEAWEFFFEIKKRKCEIIVVTNTTLKFFDVMVGEGVLPPITTYKVLCKKDSVENAVVVFEEMVKKDYVMNLITYIMLIRGLCHAGEMEKTLEFMDSMMDDELESNKPDDLLVARKLLIEMVGRGFSPRRLIFSCTSKTFIDQTNKTNISLRILLIFSSSILYKNCIFFLIPYFL
ncbi:hypothetical protein UlMin_026148 [Ulmus minor]